MYLEAVYRSAVRSSSRAIQGFATVVVETFFRLRDEV